jgi:hypothetical protein
VAESAAFRAVISNVMTESLEIGTQASQAPLGARGTAWPFTVRVASPVPAEPKMKVESPALTGSLARG